MSGNTFSLIVDDVKAGRSIIQVAPRMIEFVEGIDDAPTLKECKAQAAAVAEYLTHRRDTSVEEYNAILKVKLKVEHRLGEVLAQNVKHGGHNKKQDDKVSSCWSDGRLPDEITPKQAERARDLSQIPWVEIEKQVDQKTAEKKKASLASVVKGVIEKPPADLPEAPDEQDIVVGRMEDYLKDARNLDALITDPPYPEKYLPLYGELARLAKRALTAEGILAVMVGQTYLPDVLARMTKYLPYRWTMAYLTPGGQAVQLWDKHVNTFWKPVLLFGAVDPLRWIGDVVKSDVNDNDKRFHHWGQSESGMARLVERLTRPGQLICDPFLGGGTTGVVSVRLGRRFVGCDVDQEKVDLARRRIYQAHQEALNESA